MRLWPLIGALGGCEANVEEATTEDDGPCLEGLDGPERVEVWSGGVELLDGSEVGYGYAPQGGLYTPFFVRSWGRPELFRPIDVEGYGELWIDWSLTDAAGVALSEFEGLETVECVASEAGSYLELEFHAQYQDPDGQTWTPDREWLDGLGAELDVELAALVGEVGATAPTELSEALTRSLVLMDGLPY